MIVLKNRIIRAVLPREAVPLFDDLVKATRWAPTKIISAALAELAMRLVMARRSIDETLEDGQWQ